MRLEEVVTCASRSVELQFRVMERSLRRTGCDAPLLVIPFNEERFELPANARWLESADYFAAVAAAGGLGYARKLLVLTRENYHFIDCDAVFLDNPEDALRDRSGFIACCTQWKLPIYTHCEASSRLLEAASTTWLGRVFNSGQFACDRALYTVQELVELFGDETLRPVLTRQQGPYDQPAFNLLVARSGVEFTNLTLPPYRRESSWAGDYPGEFEHLWAGPGRKPYLMHWAGSVLDSDRPINRLFLDLLTDDERRAWDRHQLARADRARRAYIENLDSFGRVKHHAKQAARNALARIGLRVPTGLLHRTKRRLFSSR